MEGYAQIHGGKYGYEYVNKRKRANRGGFTGGVALSFCFAVAYLNVNMRRGKRSIENQICFDIRNHEIVKRYRVFILTTCLKFLVTYVHESLYTHTSLRASAQR